MKSKSLTPQNYIKGFSLCLALTFGSYFLVSTQKTSFNSLFARHFIIFLIIVLAAVQLVIQLVYFLHLGRGPNKRWNLTVFSFMLLVLLILVLGSLWIMYNLNYMHGHNHQMDPSQLNQSIIKDEGLYR